MSIVSSEQAAYPAACATCGRDCYEDGVMLAIEAAIDETGNSRIRGPLEALRTSKRRADRIRYEEIMDRFERFAIYGELEPKRELRPIEGDTWEIKTSQDRLPFYYREADGSHRRAARVTHIFEKRFGKTVDGKMPRNQIDRAAWIIGQDRNHG